MNRRATWLLCWMIIMPAALHAALQSVPLPASLNQEDAGTLNALVDGDQLRALDIDPIRPRLEELLAPDRYELLRTNTGTALSPLQLEAAGVHTRFDYPNLKVEMTIPGEARRMQTVSLVGTPNFTAARTVPPAEFSGYLNLRGGVTYTESGSGLTHGFTDPQLDFENALNYRGKVLLNEVVVNPLPGKSWEKRDTRLVVDDPERRWRWEFGDLEYPVDGLQGFFPMAGISLRKEDSLQPFRITSPLGQTSFILKQDSKVEVIINGHTVQTLQMSAGPHEIANFPLSGGANDVVLRITDPVGRVEYISGTLFYDPGLLKAGEQEFNIAAGVPSITDPSNPIYHYDNLPAASGFYRYGFKDWFAAGVNGVGTDHTQLGGADAAVSVPFGTFRVDSAATHDRAEGWGHAERLQYQYYMPRSGWLSDGVLMAGLQYASSAFTPPLPFVVSVTHPETKGVQGSFSQRVSGNWTVGASYNRQWAGSQTQREAVDLMTSFYWRGLRANVTVEHLQTPTSSAGWGAFLVVTWNFSRSQSLYSSYDTRNHLSRSEWQYQQPETIETVNATLGVQNTPSDTTGYGNLRYSGRRAEFAISQDTFGTDVNQTTMTWGTALVYADGTFGVTKPVSDSFAIFESQGGLREDGGLGVEPQGNRYLGKEDLLGPAVLPQLTGYYPLHAYIAPLQPGADFDPQAGDLRLEPTYHSGTLVVLGEKVTPNVTAKLLWSDGTPASLQAGSVTGPGGTRIEFISNRDGVLFLHGLGAGKWQATLVGHPEAPFTIVIPETKERNLNLEPIRVSIKE